MVFRGVNRKVNSFNQDSNYATDSKNVESGPDFELKKIDGITQRAATRGSSLHIDNKNGDILCIDTLPYKYNWAVPGWDLIRNEGSFALAKKRRSIDANGVCYFTATDGSEYLTKYDADKVVEAGIIPYPPGAFSSKTLDATSGLINRTDYKVIFKCQNFKIPTDPVEVFSGEFSDYQNDASAYYTSIAFNALPVLKTGTTRFIYIDAAQTIMDTTVEFTLTVKNTSTMIAGDVFPIGLTNLSSPDPFYNSQLIVNSVVNATTIKCIIVGSLSFRTFYKSEVISRFYVSIFRKKSTDALYSWITDSTFSFAVARSDYPVHDRGETSASQYIYDEQIAGSDTIPQAQIENFKDIAYFQDLIFGVTNDTLYWSIPDNIEMFNGYRNQLFNDFKEGVCTAVQNIDDFICIFKQKAIYWGSGSFGDNSSLKFWKCSKSGVGCSSPLSIQEIDRNLIFLGPRGFWRISPGGEPNDDFSSAINNLITEDMYGLKLSEAVSVADIKNSKYYCYIPAALSGNDITLQCDFGCQSWWILRGRDFTNGAVFLFDYYGTVNESRDGIYYIDSAHKLQQVIRNQLNDNGVAIPSYYKSHWEGDPSVESKFLSVLIANILNKTGSLIIKTEKNYVENTIITNNTMILDKTIDRQKLDDGKSLTLRVTFENNNLNEDLALAGYMIEFEKIGQKMVK